MICLSWQVKRRNGSSFSAGWNRLWDDVIYSLATAVFRPQHRIANGGFSHSRVAAAVQIVSLEWYPSNFWNIFTPLKSTSFWTIIWWKLHDCMYLFVEITQRNRQMDRQTNRWDSHDHMYYHAYSLVELVHSKNNTMTQIWTISIAKVGSHEELLTNTVLFIYKNCNFGFNSVFGCCK